MGGVASGDKAVRVFGTVGDVITAVANTFIVIGFGLSIMGIALSFIQFATSAGDKDGLEKAKSNLTWSGIGALVALLAYTIKNIILRVMGVM